MSNWDVLLACAEVILMFVGIAWMVERGHAWLTGSRQMRGGKHD